VDTSEDPITLDILLALQLRTADDALLPRLKTFECEGATEMFIPFIPLFLSPTTTDIEIGFTTSLPALTVASIVSKLPTLCPDLESIGLENLPRDSIITEAVSKMVLDCNQDTLRQFFAESPLTVEAREVVYRLPELTHLWSFIQEGTSLPPVALPNLIMIDIEYGDHLDWLQGFRGAVLGGLERAVFDCESERIGDFLGAFESVALTTSIPATLSHFNFCTSRSWNPNYRSLLPFTQLKDLIIEFSCDGNCSSRVDDNIVTDLAQAMPKLEILQLGGPPCKTPTGVTVKGLVTLACGCPHLSRLCIHFEATSLVEAATDAGPSSEGDDETVDQREDCALTDLEVGEIPIRGGSAFKATLALLQIFPHILNVKYIYRGWRAVAESIKDYRRVGALVNRARRGNRNCNHV